MALTLRQVCKETQKQLSKALFYFAAERKTGIAPTRKIVGLDKNALCKGSIVTVNWQGKKVHAEIGPLQDPVTWYRINYTGTQMTQWDFQNKGILTSPARLSFVLEVPPRHLCPRLFTVPYFSVSLRTAAILVS